MRVALVTAAFRARAPFDLTSHVRSLAPALARAGARVEVFCAVSDSGLAPFAQRRMEAIDHVSGSPFGVTSIEAPAAPSIATPADSTQDGVSRDERDERLAEGFGAFLDRERPSVVHFESLDAFGTQLVREARARGIATLYCASDTWPAHDRTALLLPDLSPFELGDGEAEARALLAERELGSVPPTGRFSSPQSNERLKALLHQPLTALADVTALRDAGEEIEIRRARKRAALSAVDRRFATSRLLAKELSAAVGRAFTFRAAGVDSTLFRSRENEDSDARAGSDADDTVRFAFLGSTAPEGGIDRLLDAFAAMRAQDTGKNAQLVLHLECTSDPVRDASIADRVELLGIETRWTRGPVDAVQALQGADAVVIPSLWGEVSPTMCRVALAAGVPMVASRTSGVMEAMPSSAGVLVSPSSTSDLTEALTRLSGNKDERAALVRGATEASRATKAVEDEAREWLDTYGQMVSARPASSYTASHNAARPAAPSPLPGVEEVAATLRELQELSTSELFARAQEGVGKLRRAFGLKDSDADLLARVVARGGAVRDRMDHEVTLRHEVEGTLESLHAARAAMQAEEAARTRRVADLHAILGQYEQEVLARSEVAATAAATAAAAAAEADARVSEAAERAKEAAGRATDAVARAESLEAETKSLDDSKQALEATAQGLRESKGALEARLSELEGAGNTSTKELAEAQEKLSQLADEAEKTRRSLEEVELERERLVSTLDERDSLVTSLRKRLGAARAEENDGEGKGDTKGASRSELQGELESIEAFCVALERDTEALRSHDEWVRVESEKLMSALAVAACGEAPTGGDKAASSDDAASEFSLERGVGVLERLRSELDWRRKEMESARKSGSSLRAKVLAGPLASRVRAWGETQTWAAVPIDRLEEATADFDEPEAPLPSDATGDAESSSESSSMSSSGDTEADGSREGEASAVAADASSDDDSSNDSDTTHKDTAQS